MITVGNPTVITRFREWGRVAQAVAVAIGVPSRVCTWIWTMSPGFIQHAAVSVVRPVGVPVQLATSYRWPSRSVTARNSTWPAGKAGPPDVQLRAPGPRHEVDLDLRGRRLSGGQRSGSRHEAASRRSVEPVRDRTDGRADRPSQEHERSGDRPQPPPPAPSLGADPVEQRDGRGRLRRDQALRVERYAVGRRGLRTRLDEVQQRRQAGELGGLPLAYLAGAQVARERVVLGGVESTEHEGPEEQLQLLVLGFGARSGGHWVTPISSRTVRSERTA